MKGIIEILLNVNISNITHTEDASTNNWFLALVPVISHLSSYKIVGIMYDNKSIDGKFLGSLCYSILFIFHVLLISGITWLISLLISLFI